MFARRTTERIPRGFALVTALVLVSFLVLVLMSLVALIKTEADSSEVASAEFEARQECDARYADRYR